MKDEIKPARRRFLTIGTSAVALIPLMAICGEADAAINASMRAAFKYQNKPDGDKSCRGCVHFIPGKTARALGGCKLYPGDTEISPDGYCIAWVAAPKK